MLTPSTDFCGPTDLRAFPRPLPSLGPPLPLRCPLELLRAGRRHLVLQYLRQELTAIASSLEGTASDSSGGDHAADEQRQYQQALAEALGVAADPAQQQQQQLRMPSRTQLEAAGRADLVALVVEAGGFAEVGLGAGGKRGAEP